MGLTVVGIIPARYGSSRLPGKPLLELCGKPIVQHVYERATHASLIDEVIVATDDERVSAVVEKFGGKAVLTPANFQSGSDRVAFVAKNLQADIIANIQGDEPLIEPNMIDETIQTLLDDEGVDVTTPVKKISSAEELMNPSIVKVVLDKNNFALYFSRSFIPFLREPAVQATGSRWPESHDFYKHIGVYVYRKDFLLAFTQWDRSALERAEQLEQLRILEHGHRIKCVITEYDSFSVDTKEDFERVQKMMNKN